MTKKNCSYVRIFFVNKLSLIYKFLLKIFSNFIISINDHNTECTIISISLQSQTEYMTKHIFCSGEYDINLQPFINVQFKVETINMQFYFVFFQLI